MGVVNALHTGLDINPRPSTGWQASVGWRWLHSDRHYVGSDYQEERAEERSQVINDLNTIDFSLSYSFNPRLSMTFSLPYVDNNRGSAVRRTGDPNRTVVGRSNVRCKALATCD